MDRLNDIYGLKELYEVCLKANVAGKFGTRNVEVGEPVLYFKALQFAVMHEDNRSVSARGGRSNMSHVIWDERQDVKLDITTGVFSEAGFALLTSAKVFSDGENYEPIPYSQISTLDSKGKVLLQKWPIIGKFFAYEFENNLIQKRIFPITIEDGMIDFGKEYSHKKVNLDYYFIYDGSPTNYVLDRDRFNMTFRLEGKYKWHSAESGSINTCVVIIPKVRITTSMVIRAGEKVESPMTTHFSITAMPTKTPYSEYTIVEFIQLDDDIGVLS